MHKAVGSTLAPKQPKCPPADEWIDKMWYMQIISSHKKKLSTDIYDNINNLEHKRLHFI